MAWFKRRTHEAKVRIAAAQESLEKISDSGVAGTIGSSVAFVVDSEQFFEVLIDDVLELVGGRARRVAGAARRGEDGHETGRRFPLAGERGQGGAERWWAAPRVSGERRSAGSSSENRVYEPRGPQAIADSTLIGGRTQCPRSVPVRREPIGKPRTT